MRGTIIVIGGPTAVGKTSLSIEVAKHFNAEIVSCDSRQCYREMTIGTAKPSPEELAAVPHYFIDSHSITEEFSAGDFYREGRRCLAHLVASHNHATQPVAIVTGGSGMYLRALLEGLDDMPDIPEDIRKGLNRRFEEDGLEVLQEELKRSDPEYFNEVDIHNPQRVIRALEVIAHTGRPFSQFRKMEMKDPIPCRVVSVGLDLPRELLYERINQRVDEMVEAGLVDEARGLLPFRGHYALQTVGYKEIFEYFDGALTLEEAVSKIKQNTRRYAKRQLTWFRKFGGMTWFDARNRDEIMDFITRIGTL